MDGGRQSERPVLLFVWALALVLVGLVAPSITDHASPVAPRRVARVTRSTTTSTSTTTATTVAKSATRAAIATTTTKPCRDSFDLSCGAFVWDPSPPANQAGGGVIIVLPPQPKAGQKVTFRVIAVDPDNTFATAICGVYSNTMFGDDVNDFADCYHGPICRRAYGPWTPPPPIKDTYTLIREHAYKTAGTYTVSVDLLSNRYGVSLQGTNDGPGDADGTCIDPFASRIHIETTVTVRP